MAKGRDNIAGMTVVNASAHRMRFRRSGAVWLAAILMLVFVMPFAGSVFVELHGWKRDILVPLAVVAIAIPLLIAVWSLRSGVDVDADGLRVKALLGAREYSWGQVDGFDADGRTVFLLLDSGARIALPSVRPVDLPRLIEASGSELREADDAPDDED